MTFGSNSPWLVMNAAFHRSSSLIWMLLYPHRMSIFVNRVHPLIRSMRTGMRGRGYPFLTVHLLTGRESITGLSLRFHSPLTGSHMAFFGIKKYPCLNGLFDGRINLFLRFFSMNFACSCNSACDRGNTLDLITVGASGRS